MTGLRTPLRRGRLVALVVVTAAVASLVVAGVVAAAQDPSGQPGAFTAPFADGEVAVAVQPGTAGPNEIHLYITDETGGLRGVTAPTVTLTGGGDARTVNLMRVAPGHLVAVQQHLPEAGDYDLTVRASVDGAAQAARGSVEVRKSSGLAGRVVQWCTLQLSRVGR